MPFSRVQPAKPAPGATSALYLAAAVWVFGGLFLTAATWQSSDGLGDPVGAEGNAVPLLILVVCLFAATVSFGTGAVLQRMAQWQAAEVEAENG